MIVPFDGVDDGKVHLLYTSLFVLEYFRTFVFEPMFDMPVPMEGDAGHIGFPLFRHPMDAVFGTLVEAIRPSQSFTIRWYCRESRQMTGSSNSPLTGG